MTAITTVGTDATSAENLLHSRAPSGILEGAISPDGDIYGTEISALALLKDLDLRVLSAHPDAALRSIANARLAGMAETEKQGDYPRPTPKNPAAFILAYKARPLNGVWASAPYLHNGSIPNLYALLLPEEQRPATFSVGRMEFDPRNVGFLSDGTEPFVIDTSLKGNSNKGHLYGTTLPEADRWALVEYLKTL